MLWRSLRDVAPESATLADDGRAELIYPDRREIRAWPSFELLDTTLAEVVGPAATPMLLIHAEAGPLATQGKAWHRALTAAGVRNELIMLPGADHVFSSGPAQQWLRQAVTGWFDCHL